MELIATRHFCVGACKYIEQRCVEGKREEKRGERMRKMVRSKQQEKEEVEKEEEVDATVSLPPDAGSR